MGMKIEVEACPCCGSEKLYVGCMSAQSEGVKCQDCGLAMSRYTPDEFKMKNISRYLLRNGVTQAELAGMKPERRWLTACRVQTLKIAVAAWNKRVKS